jgi:hypothetical protein
MSAVIPGRADGPRRARSVGANPESRSFNDPWIPGSRAGARPGMTADYLWIPGLRALGAHPGMTVNYSAASPANSALVSWPPKNTNSPPISGSRASTSRPAWVLPVASLTQPIR